MSKKAGVKKIFKTSSTDKIIVTLIILIVIMSLIGVGASFASSHFKENKKSTILNTQGTVTLEIIKPPQTMQNLDKPQTKSD